MSLYKRKRGNTWWVDVTTPSGERIRCSAETTDRKAAQEYHDRLKADTWRTAKLGERQRRTWNEAALRYLQEAKEKASYRDDERHVAFWTEHFRGLPLDTITRERAGELVEAKANSAATKNRYIACLRAILRKAAGDWDWLDRTPKLKTYQEPKQRIRWITKEEAEKLLAALSAWLADMARFSLATGLRQANVYGLEWQQVDLERRVAWIHADQAKAGRAIGVPLNEDAVGVIRRQLGKHLHRVFVSSTGKPMDYWISPAGKAWRSACKKAGITNFRWRDL